VATPASETPRLFDWTLLAILVVIGGSSFAMIRGAVETIPPALIGVGRLWVGAIVLYILMRTKGRNFPALLAITPKGNHLEPAWAFMIAIGALGSTIPFFIFPWAQQYVDSGLAGIYMAFMPIWTLLLAYFFTDEKLTYRKIIGFVLGFFGVIILMGPGALTKAAGSSLLPQLSLLMATFLYAAAAVLTRRAPIIKPRIFAAGVMLSAAIIATPGLMLAEINPEDWSLKSILSVIALGLGPTGLAGIIIVMLIKRTSASFMALANYITPFWAVAMGALVFHERLPTQAFIALSVILLGVAISQGRGFNRKKT